MSHKGIHPGRIRPGSHRFAHPWESPRRVSFRARTPHCIFCKIVRGEIPSARVLETAHAVAFLDINPVNPGHTLARTHGSPRPPGRAPGRDRRPRRLASPRLCRAVKAATGAEGLNVIINNGRAAGQTIDHCHWHIIPRFANDAVNWPWPQGEYSGDELEPDEVPHRAGDRQRSSRK